MIDFDIEGGDMAIIFPHFLRTIISVHDNLNQNIPYPFFDPACVRYEALRAVSYDMEYPETVISKFGITEYEFRKSRSAFFRHGTAGLVGLDSKKIIEDFPTEVERMIFVLKSARPWIPATKMTTLLKGFNHDFPVRLVRHLYASYGWALGTKPYTNIDFGSLNLKTVMLARLRETRLGRNDFFNVNDKLQTLLEVFRTLDERGVTKRYPGSRVSFEQHKRNFLSIGLLGLADRARPPFRNSKLGFAEEGRIILSKIQNPDKKERHWLGILKSKKIRVAPTCLTNIFKRWDTENFQSRFVGDIARLLQEESADEPAPPDLMSAGEPMRLDRGFVAFFESLKDRRVPLSNPGIFIFLHYLNRLKIYERAAALTDIDPAEGYSWFSFLLLNLGRIFRGISSVSKACRTSEISLPAAAGLVAMPCNDSVLNGLAEIGDTALLQLRQYLTKAAKSNDLIKGGKIAFDFKMRDFTGDDVALKNLGKGPSPKRKICFPGFRPHIAWDAETGAPISIEFRNGRARATTTIKRFVRELLKDSLGTRAVEHVYLDSEYTAEHVWKYVVDPENGLGADLTMCIKRNKKVKKKIDSFLETNPTWVWFDDEHTHAEQTFDIPIGGSDKTLRCVLKRNEKNGSMRCFGSTVPHYDSITILKEHKTRWKMENGIKDLVQNYYFDHVPGIDPHRINVHYFVVTLARILYEMFSGEYADICNSDNTVKMLDTLRPEFITGTNALMTRKNDTLVIKWTDAFPEKRHRALKSLFDRLNENCDNGLPFLGGIKIRYEIGEPRPESLRNRCKRDFVEF